MKKKIGISILILLLVAQFIRHEKNNSEHTNINQIPDDVLADLKIACYDCHSNKTTYPWYSNIQPVSWWLNKHIKNGKRDLNFDTKLRAKHYEEIIEVIEENKMPLGSYTLIHKDAVLNDEQKARIIFWASGQ